MKNLNIDAVFYHGIDRRKFNNDIDAQLKVFEDILKAEAIMCRQSQIKNLGQNIVDERLGHLQGFSNWNGSTYVSICQRRPPVNKQQFEVESKNPDYSVAYLKFVKGNISFVISPMVIAFQGKTHSNFLQDGEFQVYDKIPKRFFQGICVDLDNLENFVSFFKAVGYPDDYIYKTTLEAYKTSLLKKIEDLLEKYDYDLPIYSTDGIPYKPGKQLLQELKIAAYGKHQHKPQSETQTEPESI